MFQLTFIITACTLLSDVPSDPNSATKFTSDCKTFEHVMNEEELNLTPYTCMMKSPIYLVQFMEKHPGMAPKRWTCKSLRPSKNI